MKRHPLFPVLSMLLISLAAVSAVPAKDRPAAAGQTISGSLVGGFRILDVSPSAHPVSFTVYRGDYVKFNTDPSIPAPVLTIPALKIEKPLSSSLAETPVIKMKQTGAFPYRIGDINGTINVIAYQQANYREVTAEQAGEIIAAEGPLILDVRTPNEFKAGHLDKALLIPVQRLAADLDKLSAHKESPVLIYCATGNRSTVASKILIDNGFKEVINLRYGISDWARRQFRVVK